MTSAGIQYRIGDATRPSADGPKIIVHVCNDVGAWGRGFVLALSKRFKEPERAFKHWAAGKMEHPYTLGQVQFVQVEPELWVANLVGQHGIARKNGPSSTPPVRYEAIREGLSRVRSEAERLNATLHMPRLGAGLAGGDWNIIEATIDEELCQHGLAVTVYDLP